MVYLSLIAICFSWCRLLRKNRVRGNDTPDPVLELSGSSLRVYMLLLSERRPMSIREIQRRVGFRSPNSARHHLERLYNMGFIRKTRNGYVAIKPRSSILDLVFMMKGKILPRILYVDLLAALLLIGYIVIYHSSLNVFVIGSFIAIIAALTIELHRIHNRLKKLIERVKNS